jgi:hypothetical protein
MRTHLLLLPVFLVVSCAADKKTTAATAAGSTERPTMDQRFRGKTITQNSKGEWPAEVKKEFLSDDNRQTAYFKEKSDIPKAYKTGEYAKTSWWGKKEVERKAYAGKTDGSRFQTAARDQGVNAREADTRASVPGPYQTGNYQTGNARESTMDKVAKPADAYTENRRGNLEEPEVMGWKQLRALDIKGTRSILGRE